MDNQAHGGPVAPVPTGLPRVGSWLRRGLVRNWRGAVAALVAGWFYLPFAIFVAVGLAVVGAVVGFFTGIFGVGDEVPDAVLELPVVGSIADSFVPRTGAVLAAALGAGLGLVLGFWYGLSRPWWGMFEDDPLAGYGAVLGTAAAGVVVGLLYVLYRVVFEPGILRVTGARRPSRREADLLTPILANCAARLRLASHPPVLIDDTRDANAYAYTRHIVLTRGLLEELDYDAEAIAAVVCHEMVHWYRGDPLSAAFLRGLAIPVYLVHAAAGWLLLRVRSRLVVFLVWMVCWPVMLTVRYVIMPLQAADARAAEFAADQGAANAGHRPGMRRVLARFRRSFEGGRNGWVESVCASHPPFELRLERLEEAGRHYPLPDPDGPALPLPVAFAGSLRQD